MGICAFWLISELPPLQTISWLFVVLGFVSVAVVLGPMAHSATAKRIGQRFVAIGILGRVLLILLFVLGIWMVERVANIPIVPVQSFVGGSMAMIIAYVLLNVLRARDVEGWSTTEWKQT